MRRAEPVPKEKSLRDAFIVSAARTAVGKFLGTLSGIPAVQLGAVAIAAALRRAGLQPSDVREVIMGNVLQAGLGQHPARQAALRAGFPVEVSALTVNKVCGSGLVAVALAAQAIRLGETDIVVAGGMENMTRAPFLLDKARSGYRMGSGTLVDSLICDALWDVHNDYHMGITAENLAEKYHISREEQDAFAVLSQQKCRDAVAAGRFKEEIVPVKVPQRKGDPIVFAEDEFPKPETTMEKLARLKPAFKEGGTVTAGNASGINDGAAAVVVMSAAKARALQLEPLGVVRSCAAAGVAPVIMGIAAAPATQKALAKAGLKLEDMDLLEVNEAFAAQSLAVGKELDWDIEKVNVNGGAIALGHPVGATGAKILVTMLHEMKRRQSRYGLAALCIGGGEGIAMVVERH